MANDASWSAVGGFSACLIGINEQGLQVEVSKVAGEAFQRYQYLVRAVQRADVLFCAAESFRADNGHPGVRCFPSLRLADG